MQTNKKTGFTLLIVGFFLSWQFVFLKLMGVLKPSTEWNWKYDTIAISSVIGTIIAIVGLIILIKATKKIK